MPNKDADGLNGGCLRLVMMATNNSPDTLEQYLFQAAVPKSFQLQMMSPSGSVLAPGATISQEMRLTSSSKVSSMNFNQSPPTNSHKEDEDLQKEAAVFRER